jgi:hypothetical protein
MGKNSLKLSIFTGMTLAIETDDRTKFLQFLAKYGKSYASIDHHEERFSIF